MPTLPPSVIFTPTRFINKGEYAVTSVLAAKPEVQKMVVMTPYQAEATGRQLPAPEAKAAPAAAAQEAEPTKRETKKAQAEPTAKKDLSSVVKAWTDEE